MAKIKVKFRERIGGHAKQELVWNTDVKNLLLVWTRRGGKDWITVRKGWKNICRDISQGKGEKYSNWQLEMPRLHYWAIGTNYKHANILRKALFALLIKSGMRPEFDFIYKKSGMQLWLLHWDVLIEFRSADNPDSLVGENIAGVIGTECARWKPNVWADNVEPALTGCDGWSILNSTPKGQNWLYQDIYLRCMNLVTGEIAKESQHSTQWGYVHADYRDQTRLPGFIARVDALKKIMPIRDWERNFLANFENFEGQVFDGYTPDNEVETHPKREYMYTFGGYDHGHTHRTGIVVVGITANYDVDVLEAIGESKLLFMADKKDKRTITSIISELQEKYNCDRWYCSHERPENTKSLRDMGIPALSWLKNKYHADIGDNKEKSKRTARYLFVNRLLYINKLHFLKSQKELKKDIVGVQWKENIDGTYSSQEVLSKDDDVSDALTMAIWSYSAVRRAINKEISGFENEEDIEQNIEMEDVA